MIGLTADKLVLIAVLVGFLFGPERLPHLAERLGSAVRAFRGHLTSSEHRMSDELGVDVRDWQKLDPRQYDPRTIIRDALAVDGPTGNATARTNQDGTALLAAGPDEVEQDPTHTASDSPGCDAPPEPDLRPAFRRRSDGHLELVPPTVPTEEAEKAVPLLAGT